MTQPAAGVGPGRPRRFRARPPFWLSTVAVQAGVDGEIVQIE